MDKKKRKRSRKVIRTTHQRPIDQETPLEAWGILMNRGKEWLNQEQESSGKRGTNRRIDYK